MFVQLCKELGFEQESLPILGNAYLSVTQNPAVKIPFQAAISSLLHPNTLVFQEAKEKIIEMTHIHPYTLNMVLCISCLESLREIYEETNQKRTLTANINSLKSQLLKCKEDSDIWGIKEVFWQWMFHGWQCVRLGRLSFEPFHHFCPITYKGIRKGDPVILIHIPGGTPLYMDEVRESLDLAYHHFRSQFPNGIVPFITHSWLIYPPYLNSVFKAGGNIQKFAGLFDIIDQTEENYIDFANIFGCPYPGTDLSNVPQETSLQRNMLQFIKEGNIMGEGYGIFLYNENGMMN